MANAYGTVLTCIFIPFFVIVSVLLFINRKNAFIKCRNPEFILVQNVGTILSFLALSQYIAQPIGYWSCEVSYIGSMFNYGVLAITLLVRCWEYCINYHIAQLKVNFRSNLFQIQCVEHSWIYRHRWVVHKTFLRVVLSILIALFLSPIFIVYGFNGPFKYDYETGFCVFGATYKIASPILAGIIILAAIILGRLIYHSRDAYHMKREIVMLAVTWVIIMGVIFFNSFTGTGNGSEIAMILIMIAQIITFVISNVIPLVYAYKYDKSKAEKEGSQEDFSYKLASASFRNSFHDFLTKQFCQENLQFYEVVLEWKALNQSDPKKRDSANTIVENFVKEGAMCQVNIESELREAILDAANSDSFSEDTFDSAEEALISDMYVNSYKLFMNTTPPQKLID